MTGSSPSWPVQAGRVVSRGWIRSRAIACAVPYRPVTCTVSASGSPRVCGLGWVHDRVVPLRGLGPVAAGRQVPRPHGASHARGVAVPAHRAGDRRGWPAAGARWPVRRNGRLAVAWPVAGPARRSGAGTVVRRRGTVADRQGALPVHRGAGQRVRPKETAAASDPGLWLDVAHAVVVFPVALVTSVVTALWWAVGLAFATFALRHPYLSSGSLRPMFLYAGSTQSHIDLSLGLTSPAERVPFDTVAGLLLLFTLPLVTRACVTAQTRLGQALLSDSSALHRRISGLEQERDTARAQTVAAVTAEATALRRLERDIHDGPQQRLVRLAMELGRAQHHFDSRPEAVREALADAIVQTQEALDE